MNFGQWISWKVFNIARETELEEKLCPYCYKSIRENYRSTEDDLICPHPNCGKKIPKIYLQYPVRHIVSIYNKQDFHDYGYELGEYTKKSNSGIHV